MISIQINQTPVELVARCSVEEALRTVVQTQDGMALAVNGVVVPKSQWHQTLVAHGDELHLFRAVAGG
ncbi:sulfur carrier protein ThiS [Salinispirillum sp. LH 10-3-1]|uniref:Sulfur carrier protein ThiS n=1 Tax=Salinispirillum sp. LH 10-3-1 TaxID=2952525 RepID=A0AB38YF42_9GAMM